MKNRIFIIIIVLFFSKTNAQTLHLIMLSDYADPKFGGISQTDEEEIVKIFKTVEWGLGYKIKVSYLNSNNDMFDKAAVIKSLDSLHTKTELNDIIVFFYSGLGFYPPKSKSTFPTFKLNDYKKSPISLDDIAQIIASKNVRLGIVLADCRDAIPLSPDFLARPLVVVEDLRKLIIRKLFLEQTGIIKIASASKGNPTWRMPFFNTSAFMYSFSATFTHSLHTDAEKIPLLSFDNLLKDTQKKMEIYLKGFIPEKKSQISHWKFISSPPKLNSKLKQYPSTTFIIPTEKELKEQLNILVNSSDSLETKNSILKLSDMFTNKAIIEIKANDTPMKQITIEEYIAQTAKYDKKIKRRIIFYELDFKRTEDFKKFSFLRLKEKIEQE